VSLSAAQFHHLTPESVGQRDTTQATETARRHALERLRVELDKVQSLETRMGIAQRWEPEMEQWKAAAKKVSLRRYQRCLDKLEGLVVARIFELTKMNQSNTGVRILSLVLAFYSSLTCLQGTISANI